MQVNTFYYNTGITNLMYTFLTGGICDIENVRHAAGQGSTMLRYYVSNNVDVVDDALDGEFRDKGPEKELLAALVGAGLGCVDWAALANEITKQGGSDAPC